MFTTGKCGWCVGFLRNPGGEWREMPGPPLFPLRGRGKCVMKTTIGAMQLPLQMLRQPTESTCGPTCLHALYRYYGRDFSLEEIIAAIPTNEDGGTISVYLALHALKHGFRARSYSYNLRIFDPTWWGLSPVELAAKLEQRAAVLDSPRLVETHQAYSQFLEWGGELRFQDLTPALLRYLLGRGLPILTGLSATYLYQTVRETPEGRDDDVAGYPVGHFLVINGLEEETGEVIVTDPYGENPFQPHGRYRIDCHRLINAVMLGIVTYDANLLVIEPKENG